MEDYSVGFCGGKMIEFIEFISGKLFDALRKEVLRWINYLNHIFELLVIGDLLGMFLLQVKSLSSWIDYSLL